MWLCCHVIHISIEKMQSRHLRICFLFWIFLVNKMLDDIFNNSLVYWVLYFVVMKKILFKIENNENMSASGLLALPECRTLIRQKNRDITFQGLYLGRQLKEKVQNTKYRIHFGNTPRRIPTSHISEFLLWQVTGWHWQRQRVVMVIRLDGKSMERQNEHFLTSWPWLLNYDLDLLTWPRYPSTWPPCQNSSLYVCSFGQ